MIFDYFSIHELLLFLYPYTKAYFFLVNINRAIELFKYGLVWARGSAYDNCQRNLIC